MITKRTLLNIIYALIVVYSTAPPGYGQKTETGFLDRAVDVLGVEYCYQVYVPREFSKKQTWPVIVALHGGGEYGSDGMRQTNVGLAPAIRPLRRLPEIPNIRSFSAIVLPFRGLFAPSKASWSLRS
jgi:hypothetical protein